MGAALTRETSAEKSSQAEPVHVSESVLSSKHEHGASAGMPLFLQASFLSGNRFGFSQRDLEDEEPDEQEEEHPLIQTKLVIGQPGDAYEQEADRVAERVTRAGAASPRNGAASSLHQAGDQHVQRKCSACASGKTCSACQAKKDQRIQAKPLDGAAPAKQPNQSVVKTGDSGTPLSTGVRAKVEPVLGADLSNVKVHSDASANKAAKDLGAKAFTHQNHIWLGPQQSPDDVGLMAHEATHVAQQAKGVHSGGAVQKACACGGSGCKACSEDGEEVVIQPMLEVNATRQFEAAGVASGAEIIGAAEVAEEAAPGAPAEGEEEGGAAIEAAPAPEPADAEVPSEEDAAGAGQEGAATEAACSGAGALDASCYNADIEEPEEEPESEPTDPDSTEAREEMSSDSPEAEETDICPVEEAIAQQAPPAAAESGSAAATAPQTEAEGQAPASEPAAPQAKAEPTQTAEAPSPIEAAIAGVEAQRAAAVADYEQASGTLAAVAPGVAVLRDSVRFAPQPGESESEVGRRLAAERQASGLFNLAADRIAEATVLAHDTVPDRLGSLAESIKGAIDASIETQKQLISARIRQARIEAFAGAEETRNRVFAEYDGVVALIEEQTTAAAEALTTAHSESLGQIDEIEITTLEGINQAYAKGRADHEAVGTTMGGQAVARGEEYAQEYEKCKPKPKKKDSFFAGYLTWRRGEAQQNAARETAKGYQKSLDDAAKKQAGEAVKGRKKDRCGVIAAAGRSRETLDTQLEQLLSALESGRQQADSQAGSTRDQMLSSIDAALNSTLNRLDQQEQQQRQAANDTGYLQQVAVEQAAHAAAASVLRSVTEAVQTVQSALAEVQNTFATSPAPDRDTLDAMLSQATGGLEGGLDRLIEQVESGLAMSEARLDTTGARALDALNAVTTGNDDQASALSEGFASQMESLAEGASDTFGQMSDAYTQQTQTATTSGIAGLEQVTAGFQSTCTTAINSVTSVLADSARKLEESLQQSLSGMDCEIQKQARKAAAAEQPAWKSVVKWILIIAVIVLVALVVGPAVIGAVGAMAASAVGAGAAATAIGTIVGGAIVGAAASATIQVVNNWASGQRLTAGIGKAALMGAIGGAFGAGAGALIGKYVGAQVAQIALNVVSDAVMEIGTQVVTGEFSWEGLGMAVLMSAVTGGFGEIPRIKGIQQRWMYRGASAVPGSGAATHAASFRPATPGQQPGPHPSGESTARPRTPEDAAGAPGPVNETPRPQSETTPSRPIAEGDAQPVATTRPSEEAPTARADEPAPARPTEAPQRTTHQDEPEVEPGVVAKRTTPDGHEVKVLRDGRVVVCTDCAELKMMYPDEIAGDVRLRNRVAQVEAIADPNIKAVETEQLHLELSQARAQRLAPPKGPTGADDFDAWGARLKAAGATGDIDSVVARAKGSGDDALAAQGELRAFERAQLRGYGVESLAPPTGPSAPKGQKTPEARLTQPGKDLALEVKAATKPPDHGTWNGHADKANAQIKASGKRGEISFDWTGTNTQAGGDFRSRGNVESFLNGKMTDTRLRSVEYFEIVWKAPDGTTMVTSRTRGADGKVDPVTTRPL